MEFSQPGNYSMSPEMASSGVFVEVSGARGLFMTLCEVETTRIPEWGEKEIEKWPTLFLEKSIRYFLIIMIKTDILYSVLVTKFFT